MTGAKRRVMMAVLTVGLLLPAVAPAAADSPVTYRDEFNRISFAGSDGTAAWLSGWREIPVGDGPTAGQIQVVADPLCAAGNCLRLGDDALLGGLYRAADLSEARAATLRYTYQRQLTADRGAKNGVVRVRVSSDFWSWTTVATHHMSDDDPVPITETIDLSAWAGGPLHLVVFAQRQLDGYLFIDNVEIVTQDDDGPAFVGNLPHRTDMEGDDVTITTEMEDEGDGDLAFSATGLPQGISIDAATGVISGTIGFGASAGSPYETVVTATDTAGALATQSFTWTVIDVNRSPTLEPIADVVVHETAAMQVAVSAADPDLPEDSLEFSLVAAPDGAAITQDGLVQWLPGEAAGPGTHRFTIEVSDSGSPSLSAAQSFDVHVTEVNVSPSLGAISDQANGAGDSVTLSVSGFDSDLPANKLSYSATGLPAGLSINSHTGVIKGTIPNDAPQSNGTVTVTVRDDGSPRLQSTRTFSWQVTRGNHAPVLAVIPDQVPDTDGVVSFTAVATDADGDNLNYWLADGIDPVPSGASISGGPGRFHWKPSAAQHGATYRINVGVSDSGSPRLSDTQLVTIIVPKLNEAPQVSEPRKQRNREGDDVELAITALDPDNTLRYRATGLPSGLAIDTATGVISGQIGYEAGAGSPYEVTVTVTDDGTPQKSTAASFDWIVDETNRPPAATGTTVIALVGARTSVVLAAEDPDGDELEYEITTEPTYGTLQGEGSEWMYLTPGGDDTDFFRFAVSDGEFESVATVAIRIRVSNTPPQADGDMYDVTADELLQVGAPGVLHNDSDLDNEALVVSLVSQPDHGTLALNADGSFTYEPEEGFVGGDKFIYAVADGIGERSTATVIINVAARPTPAPLPLPEEEPRVAVVMASAPLWQPTQTVAEPLVTEMRRAVVAAAHAGMATLPEMRFPLLLLAIALLLGLTFGRVSMLPFGVGKNDEEGLVTSYDEIHQLGRIVPDDGGDEVFVHAKALDRTEMIQTGQRVRFIAADMKGRRIALKVWSAT